MIAVTNGRIAALALTLVAATTHFSSTHSFSAISPPSRVLVAARNGDARPTMAASADAAVAVAAMDRRRRRRSGGIASSHSSSSTELRLGGSSSSGNDPDDDDPTTTTSSSSPPLVVVVVGDSDATVLGATGVAAATVMIYSESVLFRTGCGLPAGPLGLVGAAEGLSYLGVVGLVCFSLHTKIRTVSCRIYITIVTLLRRVCLRVIHKCSSVRQVSWILIIYYVRIPCIPLPTIHHRHRPINEREPDCRRGRAGYSAQPRGCRIWRCWPVWRSSSRRWRTTDTSRTPFPWKEGCAVKYYIYSRV